MRRTKIVCTIGPASEDLPTIKKLIRGGMDVARLNFSHGNLHEHAGRIAKVREAGKQLGRRIAILADTRGPEIRIKTFAEGEIELQEGKKFTLTTEDLEGDSRRVCINYQDLPGDVQPGDRILIDDGLIELRAEKVFPGEIETEVIHGGKLSSRKGINLPGVSLNIPFLSQDDKRDIEFAFAQNVDFIAASFVRSAEDIISIRRLAEENRVITRIIAKIENYKGVENFTGILRAADGIMIARGDLGVEIPAEDVPLMQKSIIAACNHAGKPVITATQMLDSMIRNPRPTRAEASDVANAIFDGTDAVMLSGETAQGAFPVEAVETMARIALRTEKALEYRKILAHFEPVTHNTVTDAISYATCHAAQELGAAAIISATQSGHTARMVSKYKPEAPIIAVTPSEKVASALSLTWGVYPLLCPPTSHTDETFDTAVSVALEAEVIKNGDLVVLTAGVPVGVPGTTNFMRIDTVGEAIIRGQGVGKTAVTGIVYVARNEKEALEMEEGSILVCSFTNKNFLPALEKAAAIVTEAGGLTSHAAIVGLHLDIPVILSAENATGILSPGETITLDATRGLIYRGHARVF